MPTRTDFSGRPNKNSRAPIINAKTPKHAGQIKKGQTNYSHYLKRANQPYPSHIGYFDYEFIRNHPPTY